MMYIYIYIYNISFRFPVIAIAPQTRSIVPSTMVISIAFGVIYSISIYQIYRFRITRHRARIIPSHERRGKHPREKLCECRRRRISRGATYIDDGKVMSLACDDRLVIWLTIRSFFSGLYHDRNSQTAYWLLAESNTIQSRDIWCQEPNDANSGCFFWYKELRWLFYAELVDCSVSQCLPVPLDDSIAFSCSCINPHWRVFNAEKLRRSKSESGYRRAPRISIAGTVPSSSVRISGAIRIPCSVYISRAWEIERAHVEKFDVTEYRLLFPKFRHVAPDSRVPLEGTPRKAALQSIVLRPKTNWSTCAGNPDFHRISDRCSREGSLPPSRPPPV